MYVYNLNGVPLPFEQMLSEYPLEKPQNIFVETINKVIMCQASITAV